MDENCSVNAASGDDLPPHNEAFFCEFNSGACASWWSSIRSGVRWLRTSVRKFEEVGIVWEKIIGHPKNANE